MSSVSEWLVREYFEALGFLVSEPCKYSVPGRPKKREEELDMIVVNPRLERQEIPDHIVWTTEDVKKIARAVIGVRGWHTERFYTSRFEQTPEILRFAEAASVDLVAKRIGTTDVAKILCLPGLPASGDLKKRALSVLKEKGVDGVLPFRTILIELVGSVDVNKNYEKSDVLQLLRILKNYDLLRDDQMELFGKKKKVMKQKQAAKTVSAEPPAELRAPQGEEPKPA